MSSTTTVTADTAWWKLGKDGWRQVLASTGSQFKEDLVATLSAALTLRIVLSLVPALLAAIAIAAQVISSEDIRQLITSTDNVIPGSAREFVTSTADDAITELQDKGVVALVVSIGTGIFAASSAAVAMLRSLNVAYGVEEGRGFVGQRAASLALIGALALSLIGMFVAIVLGPTLLEFLLPARIIDSPLNILITLGRYLAAVVILMVFFGFAFWFGPDRDRPTLRFLTPGAVFGVIGWLALSYLFSLYVRVAGGYSATYGAVAGIIVLLVWLNYSFIVLLMGAELDSEIEKFLERSEHPEMPRHAGLLAATSTPRETEREREDSEPAGNLGPCAPSPALAGAAARTSGAALAAVIWARLRAR